MEECKRWIVTYTKHVRQKRKVYQDGILELHISSNKVQLYDDSGKLLDSRFLKKDDLIECGATLAFEAHLVDIDLEETQKPLQNFKVSGSVGKSKDKPEICGQNSKNSFLVKNESQLDKHGSANIHLHDTQVIKREWDVLYTAQLTQKAKRYHDGILKLISCGTHMNQLILLKEDGTTLSSKFQKSAENLSNGNTYEMPNYLVEICKQQNIQEVGKGHEPRSCVQKDNLPNTTKNNMKENQKPKLHNSGKLQNCANSEKISVTGVEEYKNNPSENELIRSSAISRLTKHEEALKNKPFRDAFQILSILRRQPQESLVTGKLMVDQTCCSQSSDTFHPDLQGSGGASLKSDTSPEITSSGITNLVSPDCKVELMADNCSTSSSLLYVKEPCNASIHHLDGESPKKNSLELEDSSICSETSSTDGLKIWTEKPFESRPEGKPNLDQCCSELQIVEQANNEKHSQLHSDSANSEKKGYVRVTSSAAANLSCVTGFRSANGKDEASELKISPENSADPDGFPSFDLGIEL